jgi:4-cresol dehydrogenase (hydroxylating)
MSTTEPQAEAITAAVGAFKGALGVDAVVTDTDELRKFRDLYAHAEDHRWDASAMVLPGSTEDVQTVVRIANEHGVPLWTFSQGRNLTYGGTGVRLAGSVLVNLRNLNRVLEVNNDLAYAVVEPGVRWFDLHAALEEAGGRLWTSIPDLGWGSVVANSSEYGRGYTAMGDHAENICGLEVVLPSGELVRTGFGAISNGVAGHVYKHAFGPQLQGLFYASGLGIITKMGFWLQRRPETYVPCFLSFQGDDALEAVVEGMRELMLEGIVTNYPTVIGGVRLDEEGNPVLEPGSDHWLARYALYGRTAMVDAGYEACRQAFDPIPGVTMQHSVIPGTQRDFSNHEEAVMAGVPDMIVLDLIKGIYGEATGHLDFSPVGPLAGKPFADTSRLLREMYEKAGNPFMFGAMLSPRSVVHVSTAFYDTTDADQTREVHENFVHMTKVMAERGYAAYRSTLEHMDLIQDTFDFGDHALRRLNETIKDAVDPNGILQPGKNGIWPRRYREN